MAQRRRALDRELRRVHWRPVAALPAARARDLMTAPPGPLLILGGLGAILFGIGLDSKRWKWLGR